MKRVTVWSAVAAAVVLAAAALAAVSWGGGWPSSCDIVRPAAPEAKTALDDRGLRVVEQGFTQPVDEVGSVSLGAVLENTGDSIAYHTRVTVQLLDSDDEGISGYDIADDQVPIIMPGQRIGVGITTHPTTGETARTTVAAFRVDTETAGWLPREALGDDFSPITAEYRGTIRRNPNLPNGIDIHFVPTVADCPPMEGWNPAVLFRDNSGTLIGGIRQYVSVVASCAHSGEETWVTPRWAIPPAAVDDRTEIYPYCDVQ